MACVPKEVRPDYHNGVFWPGNLWILPVKDHSLWYLCLLYPSRAGSGSPALAIHMWTPQQAVRQSCRKPGRVPAELCESSPNLTRFCNMLCFRHQHFLTNLCFTGKLPTRPNYKYLETLNSLGNSTLFSLKGGLARSHLSGTGLWFIPIF